MELKDTIEMMLSPCSSERLKAEYWQLKIRRDKLVKKIDKMIEFYDNEFDCTPLWDQLSDMEQYMNDLKYQAVKENIDLLDIQKEN